MIRRYREILYGLAFGLGASTIDIAMHARIESRSMWEEAVLPHTALALLYRGMFVSFGLALGWLLWKKNQHEREYRRLSEMLCHLQQEVRGPAVVIHANLQVLLTRDDFHLSAEAERIVRLLHEQSQRIQSAIRDDRRDTLVD